MLHSSAKPTSGEPPELEHRNKLGTTGHINSHVNTAHERDESTADRDAAARGPLPPAARQQPTSDARPDAIVTMASGNNAARAVVALAQSLREVHTDPRIHVVVMLQRGGVGSPECRDPEWKKARRREVVTCDGANTLPEEIVRRVAHGRGGEGKGGSHVFVQPVPAVRCAG